MKTLRSSILLIGLLLTACASPVPASTSRPTLTNSPAPTATMLALTTATSTPIDTSTPIVTIQPTTRTPLPTGTLFAERVITRPPGTLTPTPIWPTITPIPRGQRLWTLGASMPTQRLEHNSAVVNGLIYVAGGAHVKGLTYARMEVYDIRTNAWTTAAPMPLSRNHFGMAALDGKIYVTGGLPDFYRFTNAAHVYDPATDTWSEIASMPLSIATHTMVGLGGKLYVIGSTRAIPGGGPLAMFVYDVATNTWDSDHAALPTGREHLVAVVAEGKIFVIGGRIQQSANLPIVEIYDPQTDSWSRGPDMPVAVSGFTAALLDGRIHVTGGEDLGISKTFRDHQVLDLATMTWEIWPEIPGARHGLTSQAVDGHWVVIGGGPIADMSMSGRVDIFTP